MDGNGRKRAVLYARVSYDDRDSDGRNLAGQLEMAREYARRKGYQVVGEVSEDDRGASGAAFELEGLNRVLEMAEAGGFDVLIPREIDRLSRNLAKQLIVEEELKRAGVGIEYALGEYPDTPEGRLSKHIRATVAEFEREKIIERMGRGRRNAIRAGSVLVGGNPPYGYRVIKDGNRYALAVNEPEAQIVRSIYLWYVYGDGTKGPLSILAVARELEGVPSRADTHGGHKMRGQGKWSTSTVLSILSNETYMGTWHYGKSPRSPEGRRREHDVSTLPAVEVPAIIGRALWEKAQATKAANRVSSSRNIRHEYLLAQRAVCGRCGMKIAVSTFHNGTRAYQYYRCVVACRPGVYARECDAPTFRADWVDGLVWEWVKGFLSDPAALARGLGQYQAEREKENEPIRARLVVVDDLLADNRRQLDRLLELYLTGDFPKETLTERKSRLETTIGALDRERAGLTAQLEAQTLTPGQIQSLQEFAAKVVRGLDLAAADFQTRRRIVEDLDVRARLCVEDGAKVVRASAIVHAEEVLNCARIDKMV